MTEFIKKVKKLNPVLRVKQAVYEQETLALNSLRMEKNKALTAMDEEQKRYLEGVENLNKIRESPIRHNLDVLESSLDYVKLKWYKAYKLVQDLEQREKEQINIVLKVKGELKAIENLQDKYRAEFQQDQNRKEQGIMDEFGLRKFTNKDAI